MFNFFKNTSISTNHKRDFSFSKKNREAFLRELHELIYTETRQAQQNLRERNFSFLEFYPPNVSFSESEIAILRDFAKSELAISVIGKLLTTTSGGVMFNLLNYFDGTSDPIDGDWKGVSLIDGDQLKKDPPYMLHDDFFDFYDTWRESKST